MRGIKKSKKRLYRLVVEKIVLFRHRQKWLLKNSLSTFILVLIILPTPAFAQKILKSLPGTIPTQHLRGVVIDQVLGAPIEGATIVISSLNKTVITDAKGAFYFPVVPIGVHRLQVSHIAYKQLILDNIATNSGKETVLTISLENDIKISEEVTVKGDSKKNRPLNEMSVVSARAFTVEETQKYAAAVNDPLRMATGFAGVVAAEDGNNNIIIRGNSPTGLLWRMEGIDIPNPNHFSSTGSSGGGISILSAQLLSNSDFITGAFASEYGNALSGVFDLKLRKGNNEKKEYTLQAGFLGLNAAAEGPISPFYKGSYLVNYRYSTLELLNKMGVTLTGGSTNFQDLSYNIYLPTKKIGTFTLFGFGGLSSENVKAVMDSAKWKENDNRYASRYISNTGVAGLTHNILLGKKTALRSAIAFSYNKIVDNYKYVQDDYSVTDLYIDNYKTKKWTVTSTLNHKFSNRSTLRAGAIINFIYFDYYQKSKENDSASLKEVINTKDHTQTVQGFAQWQYKLVNNITLSGGLHYLQLLYNNTKALEPRGSVKWQINRRNSIAIGYGLHSQIQALGVYYAQTKNAYGQIVYPNKNLDMTKAQHFVLSYQRALGKALALKGEFYYQQLFNVPISINSNSTFSILNILSEYITDPLVNKGKGKNYGVELSLEKYLSNYFYYTVNTSFYQSKYTAADGQQRDTRFNGKYIANLVTGKEFVSSDKLKTMGINIKTIYAGGLRTTPINTEKSVQQGYTIYREKEAFSQQNPAYFRTDLRLSMKWNRKHLTSTLSLDIQNITNRMNTYGQWFDAEKGKVITTYQNGLIPVLNYKVEF
ncbi:MAG TPA: TonB-dependent receptor [Chitinophagaceae bacterium]|nr:TonB-dependent receptor [Chitinophagaceae bacterium]